MVRLSIALLGRFEVTLDSQAVTGFRSDKVRLLLAYLAVEADRAHRRDTLAGLFWPGYAPSSALTSLRTALANLRQVLAPAGTESPVSADYRRHRPAQLAPVTARWTWPCCKLCPPTI